MPILNLIAVSRDTLKENALWNISKSMRLTGNSFAKSLSMKRPSNRLILSVVILLI